MQKKIEIIGMSDKSWEEAAKNAILNTGNVSKGFGKADVLEQDIKIENGKFFFRTKLMVLKYSDNNGHQ